jgi:proton-dependent oligopeptide transporter, POT family
VSLAERWQEIRTGFQRPFWVANISELFERLSYYAAFSSLAIYLHERLAFPTEQTSSITGFFGGLVWFLAIFGGALADRLGFRRALSLAYLILAMAYFLLGSIGAPWFAPVRQRVPLGTVVWIILALPALGIALVKPSVVGTTARASKPSARSLGYTIYYTLVNIGGAAGPYVASVVHRRISVENVFRVAALSVFLMFFAVLIFFREPRNSGAAPPPSIAQTARNFLTVVGNPRFMLFLIIFSGLWMVYWQQYIALPLFIRGWVDPHADVERILITDALSVICLQFVITYLTRKIPSFRAVTLGTLISSCSWLIVAAHPAIWSIILALFVLALGEMVFSPRYYEYVSRLAPPEQQGTYMGFAFLPIGIGSLVGGPLAGLLVHHFGEVQHRPYRMWLCFSGLGLVVAALLWVYDRMVKPGDGARGK